jgi:ESS family glutamate:Na+ symporter
MQEWGIILYFLLIGVLMFIAKVLKTWVPGLNKVVMPTALLGGFIGLVFSLIFAPILIGEETFFDIGLMGNVVYHALAIGFMALALKRDSSKIQKKIWSTGMLITSTYAIQAVIGMSLVFLFFSDKFIGSGMLVALGFGQGPGLAMSIGRGWDATLGASSFEVLGASYSFIGFVIGGTVGVILINAIARKRGIAKPIRYEEVSVSKVTIEVDTVKEISLLDGLTTQAIIISVIYALVYLTLLGVRYALNPLGDAGNTIFGIFSGFHFIIAILYALLYKKILLAFERKGKNIRFMTNNYVLSNIASLAFNVMIAGAVLSITLAFLKDYGIQLVVTSILVGLVTLLYLRYMTKRIYGNYTDEYFIGLFGMLTGVSATGLALLKGIDPNLETPVAEEMVLGSGTAITMALPLFAFLFIPSITYNSPNVAMWTMISFIGIILYVIIFTLILMYRTRKSVGKN